MATGTWLLRIHWNDGDKDYGVEAVSIEKCVGALGKHASQKATITVVEHKTELGLRLIGMPGQFVRTDVLHLGVVMFSGVIKRDWNFTVNGTATEPVEVTVEDQSEDLSRTVYKTGTVADDGKELVNPQTWKDYKVCDPNTPAKSVVHCLFALTPLTPTVEVENDASDTSILPYFELLEEDDLKEVIEEFLWEHGMDYRFTSTNTVRIFRQGIDRQPKETASQFVDDLQIKGSVWEPKGYKISYRKYAPQTKNTLVGTWSHQFSYHPTESTRHEGDQEFRYDLQDTDGFRLVRMDNMAYEWSKHKLATAGTDAKVTFYPEGDERRYQVFHYWCKGRSSVLSDGGSLSIYVYADVTYSYTAETTTYVSEAGIKTESLDTDYIGDLDAVKAFVSKMIKRQKAGSTTYQFNAYKSYEPNDIITLAEQGILKFATKIRILKQTYDPMERLYSYEAEGAEEPDITGSILTVEREQAQLENPAEFLTLNIDHAIIRSDDPFNEVSASLYGTVFLDQSASIKWLVNGTAVAGTDRELVLSVASLKEGDNEIRAQVTASGTVTERYTTVTYLIVTATNPTITLSSTSPNFIVSPRYVSKQASQTIIVTAKLKDLPGVTPVWSVSPSGILTATESADHLTLTLTVGKGVLLPSSGFSVTCSAIGAPDAGLPLSCVPTGADQPLYLGTDWSIDKVDKTPDGDPLKYGDYFLSTEDGGKSASGIYMFDGDEWVSADTITNDPKAIAIACSGVLPTVLNQGMNITKRAGALYAYIGTLASTNAIIDNLFAYEITLLQKTDANGNVVSTGSIQSGNYDHATQTGWRINFDGSAEFGNVALKNADINGGQISITNSDGVVFSTNSTEGLSTEISATGVKDSWKVADFAEGLTANAETTASWSFDGMNGDRYYLNDTDAVYSANNPTEVSNPLTLNSSSGGYLYRYAIPDSKGGDHISLTFSCSETSYLSLRDKNGSTSGSPMYTFDAGGGAGINVISVLGFGSLLEMRSAGWREFVLTSRTGKSVTVSSFVHTYTDNSESYTCPAQSLSLLQGKTLKTTLMLSSYRLKTKKLTVGTKTSDSYISYTSVASFHALLAGSKGNHTCYQGSGVNNTYTDGTPRSIGGTGDKMLAVSIGDSSITITHQQGTLLLKTDGDPVKGVPVLRFTPKKSDPGATVLNLNPSSDNSKIGSLNNAFAEGYIKTLHSSYAYVGQIAYFFRLTAPDGWVACDGASGIYKDTPLYALFMELGSTYYATDWSAGKALVYDQTNDCFLLDLVGNKIGDSRNSNLIGLFLRAIKPSGVIGTIQEDEIRNIIGEANLMIHSDGGYSGAMVTEVTGQHDGNQGSTRGTRGTMRFNANKGNADQNPMAGHATGNDIHPANIALLPCIYTGAIS